MKTEVRRGEDKELDYYQDKRLLKIKLKSLRTTAVGSQFKFNTYKLKDETTRDGFSAAVRLKSEALHGITEETCVGGNYNSPGAMFNETSSTVQGRSKKQDKEWLSMGTYGEANGREERGLVKEKMNQCKSGQQKEKLIFLHTALSKEVKKSARK
uniref:Uncharacterized protein n=1 Tax=Trichobilharzia regenti TaxID=157069 RepID=A0AA85K7J0_TRIRE|nr:unnamed protein product [Trichobilharzia regenti]